MSVRYALKIWTVNIEMSDKKRYIAGYEVINSIHIGDKEIVLGMNLNDRDGHYYMLTDCERNELFERYTNSVVSNSFIELAESFLCRLNEQIEKVKIAEKDMPKGFITADMCDTSSSQNYEGKIIVIKAEVLRPECQTQAHQIMRCTGGNGALANARGSAVFCEYFYTDRHARYERYDVLGILKPEHYPEWLNKRLEVEKVKKKTHREVER